MIDYDEKKLNEVLSAFYKITGARIGIFDEWYTELVAYPNKLCKLCAKMRENSKIDEICINSDISAFTICNQTKKRFVYQCELGLFESVAPIIVNDIIIGYIMMGQIVTPFSKNEIIRRIETHFDNSKNCKEIIELVKKKRETTSDELSASSFLMSVCCEYLLAKRDIQNKSINKAKYIEEYVLNNLDKKISSEMITNRFNISRTTLFNIFIENFGESFTKHINKLKIDKAKRMLLDRKDISEICIAIGIKEKSYFMRLFKKHTGLTIKEYIFYNN